MEKRVIGIFIFLIVLVSLNFISADVGTCTYPILYISNTTNAHASTTGSYSQKVCLPGTSSPINGAGPIALYLSSAGNAHASYSNSAWTPIQVGSNYSSCQLGATCTAEQDCLLSLSSQDNAHVGNCAAYPSNKICCTKKVTTSCTTENTAAGNCADGVDNDCDGLTDCGETTDCATAANCVADCEITDAYFVDSDDNVLLGDAEVYLGDSVYLTVEGSSGCNGKSVNFSIKEADCVLGICSLANTPFTIANSVFGADNTLQKEWATQWVDDSGGTNINPEYVFITTLLSDASETKNSKDYSGGKSSIKLLKCGDGTCSETFGETCSNCPGDCGVCTCTYTVYHNHTACYGDNIYWYDDCGIKNDLFQNCGTDTCTWSAWTCLDSDTKTHSRSGTNYGCSNNACTVGSCTGTETENCLSGQICSLGECITPPSDRYWANTNGIEIEDAQLGDTVLMIDESLTTGTHLFEIYEKDGLTADEEIRTGTNGINSEIINGYATGTWKILQEDLAKTSDYDNFEFEVDEGARSKDLKILASVSNSKPVAVITAPPANNKYSISKNSPNPSTGNIDFKQESYDADDLLNIRWDYGDDYNESCTDYSLLTPNKCDKIHAYTSSGSKLIKLTAKEMTRIQSDTDTRYVFVYQEGINVFSVISDPITYGKVAKMYGGDSYVSDCDTATPCDTSSGEYQVNPVAGSGNPVLCCKDRPKPETGGNYDFLMQWIFDGDSTKAILGKWTTNYDNVVNFTYFFQESGEHEANLKIGFIPCGGSCP
ncbi:MAG: hypothetical protein WC438_00365 [Candidatus Pacearchaeota archaeon]